MSQLAAIIQRYRDGKGGVSEASVARSAQIDARTLNSWFKRGRKSMPTASDLRKLAKGMDGSYIELLRAVLHDHDYLSMEESEGIAHGNNAAKKS